MMIDSLMFLIIVFACGSIVQIVSSIICYRNIISYSKDQAMAVKMLLELLNKEFQSNQTQHTELLESLTANDQKIADSLEANIGKNVKLHYTQYRKSLPWRGDNYNGKNIETGQYIIDRIESIREVNPNQQQIGF